jgi:hypothetical protein
MRVEPAAVQEKNRMAPRRVPIEVVETHPVDHDVVVLGKSKTWHFEPGDLGGQLQVLELFRCFQHGFFCPRDRVGCASGAPDRSQLNFICLSKLTLHPPARSPVIKL